MECWFVRKPAPNLGSPGRKGRSHIYPYGRRGRLSAKSARCVCPCVAGGFELTRLYGYRAGWVWFLALGFLKPQDPC